MTFVFEGATPELTLDTDIAIVGAAPRIRDSEWGAAIDSHAEVIRINDAVVDGHEKNVGSRTTLRFIGRTIRTESDPKGVHHAEIRARLRAILERNEERVLGRKGNIDAVRQLVPERRAMHEWEDYRAFVRDTHVHAKGVPGVAYDTGARGRGFLPDGPFRSGLTLILALLVRSELRAKVHVFGFDTSLGSPEPDLEQPYHYYEKFQPGLKGWKRDHIDPRVEAEVLQAMATAGFIVLY